MTLAGKQAGSRPFAPDSEGRYIYQEGPMLLDILIAILIVAVAAVLGIVVHPILWIVIIVAFLWLFARRGRWA